MTGHETTSITPLQVIGAGPGRTGTESLKQALEILGFGCRLCFGVCLATVRSRGFFVTYPVSFSLRYLYIRPISRHVCGSVCMSVILSACPSV